MSRNQEELNEMREDMLRDDYNDQCHEKSMWNDYDYALEQYEDDITEAIEILNMVVTKLEAYGHTGVTIKDLVDV